MPTLALPDGDAFLCWFVGIELGQGGGIGTAFIHGHHFGLAVVADGLTKGPQRCDRISFGGKQDIAGLPRAVDGAIQVFPLASDLDFGVPRQSRGGPDLITDKLELHKWMY